MHIIKTTRKGIIPNEYLFIKDNAKVFVADGNYIKIVFDWDNDTGTFFKPSSTFNCPLEGDIIDQQMTSGKILRSIVTDYNQDFDFGKGTVHILCYKDEYDTMISCNKIKQVPNILNQ